MDPKIELRTTAKTDERCCKNLNFINAQCLNFAQKVAFNIANKTLLLDMSLLLGKVVGKCQNSKATFFGNLQTL